MPSDRSIRNIPVPTHHKAPPVSKRRVYEEDIDEDYPRARQKPRRGRNSRLLWIIAGIIVLVCALGGFLLATLFAGASVTVSPRTAVVTAPPSLSAQTNPPPGGLAYQVVTTSRVASTTVSATGTQKVSRPASGVATVYNAYSTASQNLIANTRFQAPDGKIYRTHDSLVVPGATKNADGTLTPGSTSITVFADSPGDSYNRGQTQFTIPGFQGDPRYSKFYAQAPAISGGFVGTEPAVAPVDLKNAEDLLKQGLDGALRTAATTQIPKEFLPIPGTLAIAYGDVAQVPGPNGTAIISQSANATADIVRAADLASAIAKQTIQSYQGEAVAFADPSQVAIALATTSKANGIIQLSLSGSPTLVWQFDPNALKQALVGKEKIAFEQIVQSFAPAIQCTKDTPCSASIRPFWSRTFPTNPDKITIVTGGN